MNCKSSPKSNVSTGMAASPYQKVKFSRKFVIELEENKETSQIDLEIDAIRRKMLRYKRRYRAKKLSTEEEKKKNKELKQELEFEADQINQMKKELEKEFSAHEKLVNEDRGIERGLQQMSEIIKSETFNINLKKSMESSNCLQSLTVNQLEELQELLFMSNKKASDIERILSREQKKNENLNKELRMLKIDLSSRMESKIKN